MTELNFYLSEEDADRLFECKRLSGHDDMTGNEYAKKLLEAVLWRMFPAPPLYDDDGNLTNPERFKGQF